MGIEWDHPMLQNTQQPQRQQSHLMNESNHGIYSIPQSWQANPLQAPARGYPVASQYQSHQQALPQVSQHTPQYQHGQMTFDSRTLNPTESSTFPSFPYQQNYYPQESFPPRPAQQQSQSSIPQFPLSSGYSQNFNPIDLTGDFPDPQAGVPQHHTIDPSFLNPTQNSRQPHHIQPNYLYGAPPEFPQTGERLFDYYQNDLSMQQPQFGTDPSNAVPIGMLIMLPSSFSRLC